jgi:hypothetical protein
MATASIVSKTPAADAGRLAVTVAAIQGLFYFATGVWPLAHIESFVAVTRPKTDLWLVYTVGVIIAVIGVALLHAAGRRSFSPCLAILAIGVALGLTAIDVIFVLRQVIDPIYLADAAVEVILVVAWRGSLLRRDGA